MGASTPFVKAVVLWIFFGLCHGLSNQYSSWYQGCFLTNSFKPTIENKVDANLIVCSKKCLKEGFYFIALNGHLCQCVGNILDYNIVSQDLCDTKCIGLVDQNLPCGSKTRNFSSIYSSAGPYIESVESHEVTQWVEPDIPKTLQATVRFNHFFDIANEPLIKSEWENTVELVWQTEFTAEDVNITANSSQELAVCTLTFPNSGNFPIELRVRNLLSDITINFTVQVVVPKPRQIQFSRLNDSSTLPSCIPPLKYLQNVNRHHTARIHTHNGRQTDVHPVMAVFANTTFILEAAVATGIHLNFNISIFNGSTWQVFSREPHKEKKNCNMPMECRSVTQEYVFKQTGIFAASANVSNSYGWEAKNITIVVMNRNIRDVSVKLVPDSRAVPTYKQLFFHLTAVTADRQSTCITVDFGDGVVKNASVREKQDINYADKSMPTLFASYGEGCNLSLQFDHVYLEEGVFNPLVTLSNEVSSVTRRLLRPLKVLHSLSGIKIKCDPIGPVNEPVQLNIVGNSMSTNVIVLWTVFDDETGNIYVNKTTRHPQTVVIFTAIGRYRISVTVSNLLGLINTTSHIVIQEPIGKVSLSCNQGPYLEIEQEVVCVAVVDSDSGVTFNWNFQDNPKSTDTSSKNSSSIAKHTFMFPGIYNISVSAHNNLSSVLEVLPYSIYVEIPIGCLNVKANSTLTSKSVNIVATSVRGTNLKFVLYVASGELVVPQQTDVNGEVTTFYAEWLFSSSGRHQVTVLAYNHISNTSRSVYIIVQDPLPEFCLVVLPSPLPTFKTFALKSTNGESSKHAYIQRLKERTLRYQ